MSFKSIQKAHYKRQAVTCETCGHTDWKTPHKLSGVHVRGLIKCAAAIRRLNRPVNRDDMDLDRNENGNFAAMRWWGLIDQPRADYWTITADGWAFLRRENWVPSHVWTEKRKEGVVVVGQDPERVSIRSVVDEDTWTKADYIARRVPVIEPGALVA